MSQEQVEDEGFSQAREMIMNAFYMIAGGERRVAR